MPQNITFTRAKSKLNRTVETEIIKCPFFYGLLFFKHLAYSAIDGSTKCFPIFFLLIQYHLTRKILNLKKNWLDCYYNYYFYFVIKKSSIASYLQKQKQQSFFIVWITITVYDLLYKTVFVTKLNRYKTANTKERIIFYLKMVLFVLDNF